MALPISVLIGILLLISPLIKKSYVAKWRYFMWLFIAVRLLFPFKISVFSTPITMELPQQIQGIPVVSQTASAEQSHVSLQTILMFIWIAGAVMFIMYQFISYFGFKRTVHRWAVTVKDERVLRFFEEIKKSIGEKRRLDIKICKTVTTPMVLGFIKPVLLLPDAEYSDSELYIILRHELIHFKRNDIWYKFILMAANALNWFNPLVYIMVGVANKDIELVCDAEVVKDQGMEFRRSYCHAILTVVHNKKSNAAPFSTCFIISKKVIKERFADILNIKKKRKGIVLFLVVALSVSVSGSLVTFATERVSDEVENELQIVERPAQEPVKAAQTESPQVQETEEVNNSSEEESVNAYSQTDKGENDTDTGYEHSGGYTETVRGQTSNTENINVENIDTDASSVVSENDPEIQQPEDQNTEDGLNDEPEQTDEAVSTDELDDIYNSIGEPDSVSSDGSKETYSLSDGNTVILQYEDDELDTGYIIVE